MSEVDQKQAACDTVNTLYRSTISKIQQNIVRVDRYKRFWDTYLSLNDPGEEEETHRSAKIKKKDMYVAELFPITLPAHQDKSGFHIVGTTRQGKSVLIMQILYPARQRGVKGVINDPKGEFLKKLWKPGDHIMNMMDKRCSRWSPLAEIVNETDYITIATSFFPDDPNSKIPQFTIGARMIFAAILRYCKENDLRNPDMLALACSGKENLLNLLGDDPEAKPHLNSSANSVGIMLAMLQTKLFFLKFMEEPEDGKYFSIREWIDDLSDHSWVFLSYVEEHQEIMKPYISAILDQICLRALSMPKTETEIRLMVVVDEIGRLQPLPSIPKITNMGAGLGVRWIIAHQAQSQLVAIYGQEIADSISQCCGNKFIFACGSIEGAGEWCSAMIGSQVVIEKRKTTSAQIGADSDSKSNAAIRIPQPRPLVNPSDFKSIPPLHCYVSLLGGVLSPNKTIPFGYTTLLGIKYLGVPDATEAFEFRDLSIMRKFKETNDRLVKALPSEVVIEAERDGKVEAESFMPINHDAQEIVEAVPEIENIASDLNDFVFSAEDLAAEIGM